MKITSFGCYTKQYFKNDFGLVFNSFINSQSYIHNYPVS